MSLGGFIGWTLGTAVLTPIAPFGLIYACCHEVHQSGNGADAWMTFGLGAASFIACIALGALILVALANPVVAACLYGAWCLGVGITIGLAK